MIPSATAKWASSFRRTELAFWFARAVAVVTVAIAVSLSSAEASGRLCLGTIVTNAAGDTEEQAKRVALEAWRNKAAELGTDFQAWRLSIERSLNCSSREGGFVCRASARPCVLRDAGSRGMPKQSAAR